VRHLEGSFPHWRERVIRQRCPIFR
jgi:hypothetical protein